MDGLKPLIDKIDRKISPDEILETHAFYESSAQKQTPGKIYSQLLAVVYKRLAEEWQIPVSWSECLIYGYSVKDWPVFSDSVTSLTYLQKYYKLVILSNVDNVSFTQTNKKLEINFHASFTAEDIGYYKPSRQNFEYMLINLTRMGIQKKDVLHTAESMFHDHVPANCIGLANCWINRRHDRKGFGATMDPVDIPWVQFTFNSLNEMVEAHKTEIARDNSPQVIESIEER